MRHALQCAATLMLTLGGVVLFSQGVHAQALGPLFAPKGQVRFAYAFDTNAINTSSTTFVDVPSLAATVTIPKRKVADVLILFSGEMNSPSALYVQAAVDGIAADPGAGVQAFWGVGGGATSQSFNFHSVIGQGTHTITMQWAGLSGSQFMNMRSMTIILNLRHATH